MAVDTVQKTRKCLPVDITQVHEMWIGGNCERFLAEAEKITVHLKLFPLSRAPDFTPNPFPSSSARHIAGIDTGLNRNTFEYIVLDPCGEKLPLRQRECCYLHLVFDAVSNRFADRLMGITERDSL